MISLGVKTLLLSSETAPSQLGLIFFINSFSRILSSGCYETEAITRIDFNPLDGNRLHALEDPDVSDMIIGNDVIAVLSPNMINPNLELKLSINWRFLLS